MFDTEIKKHKFHYHKNPILIDDVDINKIIVSNKVSFRKTCFKYFTGTKIKKFKSLNQYIVLPKRSGYTKSFIATKYMSFLIKDDEFLDKYNKICDQFSNSIK